MGKTLIGIVIIVAVAFAWHQGWIQKWFNTAVDSSIQGVRSTQRDATKVRPVDAPPAEKK